jgi:cytochrome b561
MNTDMTHVTDAAATKFSVMQRVLHWIVAVCVLALLPIGFWMADRGEAGLWDNLTGNLYASHKTVGFIVLWLVIWRIILRARRAAPSYPSSVPAMIQILAKKTQRWMYILLLAMPLTGWAGVTAFPALNIFAGLHLPAMPFIPQDQALAKQIFEVHGWLAIALCVLVALHVAGALKHKLIDRDGVFEHMT